MFKSSSLSQVSFNMNGLGLCKFSMQKGIKENSFTILKVSHKTIVISSMESVSNLPNRPPTLSVRTIQKMINIIHLKELERTYDNFIDKHMQILLLYNVLEDYLDIRDALTVRISKLRRENKIRYQANKYLLEE